MLSHTARREITSHLSLERERGSYDCYDCKAGRYELCPSIKFAASPPFDGTLQGFYDLRRLYDLSLSSAPLSDCGLSRLCWKRLQTPGCAFDSLCSMDYLLHETYWMERFPRRRMVGSLSVAAQAWHVSVDESCIKRRHLRSLSRWTLLTLSRETLERESLSTSKSVSCLS
ncbi:hypothetical protein BT69DRAFT_641826 [Atractiella rhizophila]|nr:hypothetical protein BT69DRAFT_641826 [Atractiella rhizophila]